MVAKSGRQVFLCLILWQMGCNAVISLATLHRADQALLAAKVAGAPTKATVLYQHALRYVQAANRADGYSQFELSVPLALEALEKAQDAFEYAKHPPSVTWCQWTEPQSPSHAADHGLIDHNKQLPTQSPSSPPASAPSARLEAKGKKP